MRTFSPAFDTAKNKPRSEPVNLLRIDWPETDGSPAWTMRLSDRTLTTATGQWVPAVADWGEIDRQLPGTAFPSVSGKAVRFELINGPIDFGRGPERFSDVLNPYIPETARVTLYQWYRNEGLVETDEVELLTGSMSGPIEFDEARFLFYVVEDFQRLGQTPVGNIITLNDYPDAPEQTVGRIKPMVIGRVENVPGLLVRKTHTTRLTSVVFPQASVLDVASTNGFLSSGQLIVNDDIITYTGITALQFTGCSGIQGFHYAGEEVLEKVNDHRYLFSDPQYPIESIDNVKVAGVPVDPSQYQVDPLQGEVVFTDKPRRVESTDTRFLQAQFDTVAEGNTALNPLHAIDPFSRTQSAQISQVAPLLKLKQTTGMGSLGEISKVFLRVEHFAEEKLPNDSIVVRFEGLGSVGTLSAPSEEDLALTSGSTDITHTHLDTFGFPVNQPNHLHTATSEADHVLIQGANSGPGGNFRVTDPNDVGPHSIPVTFPAPPAGVLKAEYKVNWRLRSITFASGLPEVKFNGVSIGVFNSTRSDFDYTPVFTTLSGSGGDSWNITLNTGALWFDLLSVERTLFYGPNPTTLSNPLDTVKSGDVTQHGSSPVMAANTDKATDTVVDLIDISSLVNRDWNWFTDRVLELEYTGTADGRTVFVIHTAFEIEFARRRWVITDDVTADVSGVIDDPAGTVTGTPLSLIERPDHVFRWSLRELVAPPLAVIDEASFALAGMAWSEAITGGYALAGRVQEKTNLENLWEQWMKESRSYLFWDAQGRARLQFRPRNQSAQVAGTEVKTLNEDTLRVDSPTGTTRIAMRRTPLEEVVNSIELQFRRDWKSRNYAAVYVEEEPLHAARYGRRERPGRFQFDWCRSLEQAQDLARFYLEEGSAPQILVECETFLQHLELERGDVVKVDHPLLTGSALLGLVMPGVHCAGSGLKGRMDSQKLVIRLFPQLFLQETLDEATRVSDQLEFLAEFFIDTAESIEVVDGAFTEESAGWGSQDWGVSGWGGKTPL